MPKIWQEMKKKKPTFDILVHHYYLIHKYKKLKYLKKNAKNWIDSRDNVTVYLIYTKLENKVKFLFAEHSSINRFFCNYLT